MLKDIIRTRMNEALKNANYKERAAYSLFLDALEKKEKNKMAPLTKQEEDEVVLRLIKMSDESVALLPETMTWRFEEAAYERKIFEEFAPKHISREELEQTIESVLYILGILETANIKDKGRIMKNLIPLVKGKADGQLVNKLVEDRLGK